MRPSLSGFDPDAVASVRRAGHVHDLGRIGVSNSIWSKPGQLTSAEFERVRLHPYLTVRILCNVRGLAPVAQLAGNHHECIDGSGYPRGLGLTAREIEVLCLAARCFQQRDRGIAGDQREDGTQSRRAQLRQDRRLEPDRREHVCVAARAGQLRRPVGIAGRS
jgi:HD domain